MPRDFSSYTFVDLTLVRIIKFRLGLYRNYCYIVPHSNGVFMESIQVEGLKITTDSDSQTLTYIINT
jgi:hypothetical protein